MKKYVEPQTAWLQVLTYGRVCKGSPTSTGGDPAGAQLPSRKIAEPVLI